MADLTPEHVRLLQHGIGIARAGARRRSRGRQRSGCATALRSAWCPDEMVEMVEMGLAVRGRAAVSDLLDTGWTPQDALREVASVRVREVARG